MSYFQYTIDPDEVLSFTFNWTEALEGAGIDSSAWEYSGDLTVDNITASVTATGLRITGGVAGAEYIIKNTITTDTSPSQTLVRRMQLNVRKR